MGEDNPLEFITTEELIHELLKRSSHLLVIHSVPDKVGADQQAQIVYGGGLFSAIGMAAFAHQELLSDLSGECDEDEEDEF